MERTEILEALESKEDKIGRPQTGFGNAAASIVDEDAQGVQQGVHSRRGKPRLSGVACCAPTMSISRWLIV